LSRDLSTNPGLLGSPNSMHIFTVHGAPVANQRHNYPQVWQRCGSLVEPAAIQTLIGGQASQPVSNQPSGADLGRVSGADPISFCQAEGCQGSSRRCGGMNNLDIRLMSGRSYRLSVMPHPGFGLNGSRREAILAVLDSAGELVLFI